MNGAEGGQGLDAAAKYVADALGQLTAREQELRGKLQLTVEERKRLITALRALEPDHPLVAHTVKPGPKKQGAQGKSQTIYPETMAALWEWIKEQGEESFTIKEAAEALRDHSTSHDPFRRGIYALRDAEAVRLAGKERRGNAPQPSQIFRLLDVEAGDRVVEENAAAYPAHQRSRVENLRG